MADSSAGRTIPSARARPDRNERQADVSTRREEERCKANGGAPVRERTRTSAVPFSRRRTHRSTSAASGAGGEELVEQALTKHSARARTRVLEPATIDLVRIVPRVRPGLAPLACVAGGLLLIGCAEDTKAIPQLSGTDHANRAEFVLTGNTLTVTLASGSGVVGLVGQSVRVNCVSQRAHNSGVARTLRWRPRSRRLRVRFSAKVGAAPVFCSIDTASLMDHLYHVEAVLS